MKPLTKEILSEHFGPYLIKVSEKKEYLDELLSGRLYMKEAGYFRKVEDTYRGDRFDGRKPLDVTGQTITLEAEDGTKLVFNDSEYNRVTSFSMGFAGDHKVPIFCACLADAGVFEITGDDTFRMRKEYLEELSKFGSYAAFLPLAEMYEKIRTYNENHPETTFLCGPVEYTDIRKAYSPQDDGREDPLGAYRAFFKKDQSYRYQNEWRAVLVSNQRMIPEDGDSLIIDLGRFQYAVSMEMDNLLHGEFHFCEKSTN